MKHAREDYQGRIVDLAGLIPDEEPCLLFRGQDVCAPHALDVYARLLHSMDGDRNIVDAVYAHADAMRAWQATHVKKMPDLAPPDPGACAGCGSIETIEQIQARHPDARSCCPERKMLSAAEWMARATSAEKALEGLPEVVWPKVPSQIVEIFVVHASYQYAAPADRSEWCGWYPAHWSEHNGGGWVWHGMIGQVLWVRPASMPRHLAIMSALK